MDKKVVKQINFVEEVVEVDYMVAEQDILEIKKKMGEEEVDQIFVNHINVKKVKLMKNMIIHV